MILFSEIDYKDRHVLLVELEHTTTSSIYKEGYFLKNENPIQLFYKELKKPAK